MSPNYENSLGLRKCLWLILGHFLVPFYIGKMEMISGSVLKFCCEDISLIENYKEARYDTSQIWECHHRLEIQGDKILSMQDLKEMGLYYNRPASELIFLTRSEHRSIHGKGRSLSDKIKEKLSKAHSGKILSEEHKKKISKSLKGKNNPMYGKKRFDLSFRNKTNPPTKGKKMSEEQKMKISKALKGKVNRSGENNSMYGKHHTEETKRKISKSLKERNK